MKNNTIILFAILCCSQLNGQNNLTSDQIKEEEAYALGIEAAIWGRPLIEYNNTIYAGAKASAAFTNYFRRYDNLKTAVCSRR